MVSWSKQFGFLAVCLLVMATTSAHAMEMVADESSKDSALIANLSPELPSAEVQMDAAPSPENPKSKVVELLLQSFNGNTDFAALSEVLQHNAVAEKKPVDMTPKQVAAKPASDSK